ncbi:MAG: OmpA family protein, partial [Bacteroidales bacterium]|nr:OmpA family protein [Bacteroidales bacterium]
MKRIATIFAAFFCTVPLLAQTIEDDAAWKLKADTVRALKPYKGGDNWFISIQGGVNHSLSENARFGSFGDMTKPSFALSVGKYFSPAIGARLQFAYMKQESRANSEAIEAYPQIYGDGNYGFNVFGGYLDGLFNLNNIFGQYRESSRFSVVGVLGMGFNTSGGFDDKVKAWDKEPGEGFAPYKVYTESKTYFALRGGLQFNYILSKAFDLGLEATFNATDDGYNGTRYDRKWDSYANVMLGLTYHFKDQYGDRRFRYTELNDQAMIDDLNRQINEERAKVQPVPEPIVEVKKEVV